MADLVLSGLLDFHGMLTLQASGGKVKVESQEVLVELPSSDSHGLAPPVILPPPPAAPITTAPEVVVLSSLNKTVKAGEKAIVTQGMVIQGSPRIWPGMVLPSQNNTGPVTVNHIPINVLGDQAIIFPSGGSANLTTKSGQ
jgi:hypothetical protein